MAYPLEKETIDTIMAEGAKAFNNNSTYQDNPYPKSSTEGRLWIKGYANAYYGAGFGQAVRIT